MSEELTVKEENTINKSSMDVARILIRTKRSDVTNKIFYVNVNGFLLDIKMIEAWCGPLHWNGLAHSKQVTVESEYPMLLTYRTRRGTALVYCGGGW